MNNALLVIGSILVAALTALFAVPYVIDWNGYRGVFEEEASRVLGREVRVSGDVNLRLLPAPYVEFEKIRVANEVPGEPMFRADDFTMWLAVPPLLRGVLEAKEITLKRPTVRISLNDQGTTNWQSLSINPGSLPFVPSGFALQSVKISKGLIIVQQAGGAEFVRIEDVNGELAAEALEGPFKFAGTASWGGGLRDIKLATAAPAGDGRVAFKAAVKVITTGNSYVLDGHLDGLDGQPQFGGDLTAKINIDGSKLSGSDPAAPPPSTEATAGAGPPPAAQAPPPSIEAKATLAGDGMGAALTDLNISVDNVGQPQLMTGQARTTWQGPSTLDFSLESKWLDLDRLSGTAAGASPLEAARSLLEMLAAMLPDTAETNAMFTVDQVNLGGEAISSLDIAIGRQSGALVLKLMRAGLPGAARIDLTGTLTSTKEQPSFSGSLGLRGPSLARFVAWANKTPASPQLAADGPFALHGRLALSPTSIAVSEASAELAGSPVEGEMLYETGDTTRLVARLEGRRVDIRQFLPDATASYVLPRLSGASGGPAPTPPMDLDLRLRVAELVTTDGTIRNVDADLSLVQGKLTVKTLKLITKDELALDVEGAVASFGAEPVGSLRWIAEAPSAQTIQHLIESVALAPAVGETTAALAALAPFRLAGALKLGDRSPGSADWTIDGATADGGRLRASARLDGGLGGWRAAPVELQISLDSPNLDGIFAASPQPPPASTAAEGVVPTPTPALPPPDRSGTVRVSAVGTPQRGVYTVASLAAADHNVGYEGTLAIAEDASTVSAVSGRLSVSAASMHRLLAAAGFRASPALGRVSVAGQINVDGGPQALNFNLTNVMVNETPVSGRIAATRAGEETKYEADLEVADASVISLLAAVIDQPTGGAGPVPESAEATIWPEAAFNLSALNGHSGQINVKFRRLEIAESLALQPAQLEATLSPGKITITKLDGAAIGGTFGSALTLEQASGGVSLKGALRLAGIELKSLQRDAAHRPADGQATIDLAFAGQALSPVALMTALTGTGSVELKEARVTGLSADAVALTSESVLLDKTPGKGAGLMSALQTSLGQGWHALGTRQIPIEIADGAARLKAFTIDDNRGRTAVEVTVDLNQMRLDAEWRIEARPGAADAAQRPRLLPPVRVVYVGPLGKLADLEPQISADGLERELAVLRLEQDVSALERLRQADEARALKEAERLQALDAERLKALEADQTPSADPAAGTPVPDTAVEPGAAAPSSADPLAPAGTAWDSTVPQAAGTQAAAPPLPVEEAPAPTPAQRRPVPRKPDFNPFEQLN